MHCPHKEHSLNLLIANRHQSYTCERVNKLNRKFPFELMLFPSYFEGVISLESKTKMQQHRRNLNTETIRIRAELLLESRVGTLLCLWNNC
jgi:hypothetical protein